MNEKEKTRLLNWTLALFAGALLTLHVASTSPIPTNRLWVTRPTRSGRT